MVRYLFFQSHTFCCCFTAITEILWPPISDVVAGLMFYEVCAWPIAIVCFGGALSVLGVKFGLLVVNSSCDVCTDSGQRYPQVCTPSVPMCLRCTGPPWMPSTRQQENCIHQASM